MKRGFVIEIPVSFLISFYQGGGGSNVYLFQRLMNIKRSKSYEIVIKLWYMTDKPSYFNIQSPNQKVKTSSCTDQTLPQAPHKPFCQTPSLFFAVDNGYYTFLVLWPGLLNDKSELCK